MISRALVPSKIQSLMFLIFFSFQFGNGDAQILSSQFSEIISENLCKMSHLCTADHRYCFWPQSFLCPDVISSDWKHTHTHTHTLTHSHWNQKHVETPHQWRLSHHVLLGAGEMVGWLRAVNSRKPPMRLLHSCWTRSILLYTWVFFKLVRPVTYQTLTLISGILAHGSYYLSLK